MNNIQFIVAAESRLRFAWEIAVQLNNAREMGISDKFRILLFNYKLHEPHPNFKILERLFPEAKFFYYTDIHDVFLDIQYYEYVPLIRPYMLRRHFKEFPELEYINIFYLDSDVLFLNTEFITPLLDGNAWHISDAHTYLDYDYLLSKENDVLPGKLAEYKNENVIATLCKISGITIEEFQNSDIGGVQYVLKNINYKFWGGVYHLCCDIRKYLRNINKKYFENEDKGIQSWASDLWAMLFTMWKHQYPVKISKNLDFAWATDRIKPPYKNLLHNAGITNDAVIRSDDRKENGERIMIEAPAFYKTKYGNSTPFEDVSVLEEIINHPISSQFYTSIYSKNIINTKNNLNL